MSPMSAEATVVRNYLDWMIDIPWFKKDKVDIDLKNALKVLDDDHYGSFEETDFTQLEIIKLHIEAFAYCTWRHYLIVKVLFK